MKSIVEKYDVLIIGGGASGLFAAISAARRGASVCMLEKMDRPGRKLAITGKGRCNLTTACDIESAIKEFGRNGKFLRSAFSRFYSGELLDLLSSLGIEVAVERGQRVFPICHRAPDVVRSLVSELGRLGVKMITGTRVVRIRAAGGHVTGAETGSGIIPAGSVVLATGGASYPGTGSTGDGYELSAALGHTIVKPIPALVPIVLAGEIHGALAPLDLRNVRTSLFLGGKKICEEFGELSFTTYGITGPTALPLGKHVAANAGAGRLSLIVNLKPALSNEILDARIRRELTSGGSARAAGILTTLLPMKAVPVFEKMWGLPAGRKCSEVTKSERDALRRILTALEFTVKGTRPMAEAIVTAGGVKLGEVDPKTMESKLVKGLFICGELLDLDAGTGGFNLQAAFSTGWIAGESAV